jgi:TolB-like protein/class 3 adenylate cyclase
MVMSHKRKLAAILSADAVGYSRLMAADEAGTVETLKSYRDIIARLVTRHGGRVVNAPGDALLAEFQSAVAGVQAAVEIQKSLEGRNVEQEPERRMQFRIGVNLGDVIEEADGALYGDGVNIAARLEALAEAGGICISYTVYDAVEGKVPFGFDFLGEQQVKNIPRPVRVYRVRAEPRLSPRPPSAKRRIRWGIAVPAVAVLIVVAAIGAWRHHDFSALWRGGPIQDSVLNLPKGPGIAVLPFVNLSGDPREEPLADGITEDIITKLSHFPDLFVIARNSTFKYKGKSTDVRDVGKDLGVTYVLEGSIQSAGPRLRATAQLIDARTGAHAWGEAFDRERTTANVLELQDEITAHVVAKIASGYGVLSKVGAEHTQSGSVVGLDSYACVLQARAYTRVFTGPAHLQAQTCLEAVVKKDPDYTEAWAWLALIYLDEHRFGYNLRPERPRPLDAALEAAKRAVSLDPENQYAQYALAKVHYHRHESEEFFIHAAKALALNPNNVQVLADIGFFTAFAGQWDRGLSMVRKAMALDPNFPGWYHHVFFYDYYRREQYEQALDEALKGNTPGLFWNYVMLTAAYGQLGRNDEAKQTITALLKMYPGYPQHARDEYKKYTFDPALVEHVIEGLRKAGLEIPPA